MIPVAFDMRDPVRSGIARVARSMARAFAEDGAASGFQTLLCGPVARLRELGADQWGTPPSRLVPWNAGRFSLEGERTWPAVRAAVGQPVWYFPHWDVPWIARPRRSIVLINDVIPINVPGATTGFRREIARRWIRWSGLRATRIAVSTEFTRGELLDIWPDFAGKVRVIPLGVDPRFFGTPEPLAADVQVLVDRGPFMLSVGNRKAHKNLLMGPEVLARVPDIRWIVVGEPFAGWDQVVHRAAALGVSSRMEVLEPQTDAVVHALYARAACLFFPSRNEGFGLPVLEALAAGTRVVIGAAGASMEVLGGLGGVCGLDDPDSFAGAVAGALHAGPPGPEGRARAAAFTWNRSARMVEQLVREIA